MKHRTTAIHGSKIPIPGYPKTLRLYKIPASQFFQVKARVNGVRVKRSTKTENLSEAIAIAKAFYNELLVKASKQQPLIESKNFEKVVKSLIQEDQGRVDRGERSEHLVRDAESIFESELLPFFRKYHVREIGYEQIQEYIQSKKGIKTNTLKNHIIFLRKALKHAHKKGLLDKLPIFPTLSIKANPREWFTLQQYDHLRKVIKDCKGETAKKTYVPITDELRHLTTFLVNTFLRPNDIKELRHRHIEVVETKKLKYLRIMPPTSKTTDSPVVSMSAALYVYEDLKKLNGNNPEDFVFFPALKNRGYAFQTMRLQFNHVLEKAGLKQVDGRVPRTLYSLRHTAIMFRLTKGDVDLLTLARNCRTSIEMLEKFYASHLKAEMNVAKLQSMR